jgi:RimJ/RimL family protein N-acetyltransferase
MNPFHIRTDRLDLIPATLEILEADRDDHQKLARLLSAAVPGSWPPPLLDEETLGEFIRMTAENADPFFITWYWVRDDSAEGSRVLVGSGGTASAPVPGTVLIGYSVLEEFQRRGYATEAVRHIVAAAFALPGIRRIVATTYPDLVGSIRVLEKNGFTYAGEGPAGAGFEEGTVAYVLEKPGASL